MVRNGLKVSVVVLAAVLSSLLSSPAGAAAGFGDVPADAYYTEAVQWMVDEAITTGTAPGCFAPDAPASRAEVAVFLHRLVDPPAGGSEPFVDVAADAFYADAVAWMFTAGITTGTSPSRFSPDQTVTRGEIATFLHRLDGLPDGGDDAFSDVPPDAFFAAAVAWMASAGITQGRTPTTFDPYRPVTRAEIAAFLYRYDGSPPVAVADGGECGGGELAGLAGAELRSFDALNDLRRSLGLAPLERDATMDAYARAWSETLHDEGGLRHSEGPYGENLGWWGRSSGTASEAADLMHQLWVDSPGHYRNMTDPKYTRVGVGFFQGPDGWYATHVFA